MKNLNRQSARDSRRSGFTLIELLLVIAIIAILSSLGLAVMAGAEENALRSRTNAQIERLSQVLNQHLEENIYRVLPVRLPVGTNPQAARDFRKNVLAEFIRVEFPSRPADVDPLPANFPVNPALAGLVSNSDRPQISNRYWAVVSLANAANFEAECLYAILSLHTDEHGQRLISLVASNEIADTDGDGVKEVLDAFGDPLQFRVIDPAGIVIDPAAMVYEAQEYRVVITSINTQGKL